MTQKLFLYSVVLCLFFLSACSETQYAAHVIKQIPFPSDPHDNPGYFKVGNSYNIQGTRYRPTETYNHTETGMASWYGPGFNGKMTANGEIFDENELTAAHRTLQLPSIIEVTNLSNGRSVILRVNDRGPFARDRILDVSKRAASLLGFKSQGTAKIRLEVLSGPSHEVASRAKAGKSTKGYEIALAQHQRGGVGVKESTVMTRVAINPEIARAPVSPLPQVKPVTEVSLTPSEAYSSQPVPLKKPMPVQVESLSASNVPHPPTLGLGRIYVQTGAFSNEQNALQLSQRMSGFGPSKVYRSVIDGRTLYRVRLGPYNDRVEASTVIYNLEQNGTPNAVIVTE